jgi:hypothetical protein
MQVLNGHMHVAIDLRATEPQGEVCELAIIPMQGMDRRGADLLHLLIKPEDWGRGRFGATYRKRVSTYGHTPQVAQALLQQWFDRLELRFNKRLIPVAYNWPAQRELLLQWLGFKPFESVFHAVEYRDLIPVLRYWTEYQFRAGEHIPFPKCSLRHFAARFGIDIARHGMNSLERAELVRQCYAKIMDLYLPLGYSIPLFDIMPIDYAAAEISDDTALDTLLGEDIHAE